MTAFWDIWMPCMPAVSGSPQHVQLCADTACTILQGLSRTVEIPRSVPGLATGRLLVMTFVDGDQITRLEHRTKNLSARWIPIASQCLTLLRADSLIAVH